MKLSLNRAFAFVCCAALFVCALQSQARMRPAPVPNWSLPAQTPPPTPRRETFWEKLLRITGISANPNNQKGNEEVKPGRIWVADLNRQVRFRVATAEGGYRSPIFYDAQTIIALRDERVVRIAVGDGKTEEITTVKGIIKLVGHSMDDPNQILIIKDEDQDTCPAVALLSLTDKTITVVPRERSEADDAGVANLLGWVRTYNNGETKLQTEIQSKRVDNNEKVKWTDVILKQKNRSDINVSKCDGVNCTQPSLSNDGNAVVFIKEN